MRELPPKKIVIDQDFCNACRMCLKICKEGALEPLTSRNARGYHPVHWKGECSLCGDCKAVCSEFAIELVTL